MIDAELAATRLNASRWVRAQGILLPSERLPELVANAVALLQFNAPLNAAYYGAFSGGKDSCVIKELARIAGVRVEWHYNVTTIDPPELLHFMREYHPDVKWDRSRYGNFFHRMVVKGIPTRVARWCCEDYKETRAPRGSQMILGVRAAESPRRAKRWQLINFHTSTHAWCVAPIVSWSDADVWEFIHTHGLPYCSLYDEGFKRLGCIGCPMAREVGRRIEFARWPRFEALWQKAFQRLWERRTAPDYIQRDGRSWQMAVRFKDWREMWEWWLSDDPTPETGDEENEDGCQLALDMLSGGTEIKGD